MYPLYFLNIDALSVSVSLIPSGYCAYSVSTVEGLEVSKQLTKVQIDTLVSFHRRLVAQSDMEA